MLIYVAHSVENGVESVEKAKDITKTLQFKYPQDCFICPLIAFSNISNCGNSGKLKNELKIDLLSVCDRMIVASLITPSVEREIEFAHKFRMEVDFLN